MHGLDLIGSSGSELTALQMSVRAALIFLLALLMLRAAGRRSLGKHNAFDTCVAVLLGAVLSRAVVGASPFWPTVGAAFVIVVLHRLLGLASVRWQYVEDLINGTERRLVKNGRINWVAMRKALVKRKDLSQAMRERCGAVAFDELHEATLERDGKVTVALKGLHSSCHIRPADVLHEVEPSDHSDLKKI